MSRLPPLLIWENEKLGMMTVGEEEGEGEGEEATTNLKPQESDVSMVS
jgi:hypothetical protein